MGITKPPSSAPIASVAAGRAAAALVEQLVQPLELAFVVAEDDRGRRAGEQRRAAA